MLFWGCNRKIATKQGLPNQAALLSTQEKSTSCPSVNQTFRFSGCVISDVGSVRLNNEDNYILGKYLNEKSSDKSKISVSFSSANDLFQFAGVFDGMGGGEMGELASRDTAAIFLDSLSHLNKSPSKAEIDLCIRKAFLEANNRIVALQKEYKIFGTTGTVLCSNGLEFKIYHLGDSRAYLIRDKQLMQLTKDQTLAQMKMDVGMYKDGDPAAEIDKHKLTEYIGRDRTRENIKPIESYWIQIQPDDHVLLCSDGLYDMCKNEEIASILYARGSTEEKTASLVQRAIENGGEDNITCILISLT